MEFSRIFRFVPIFGIFYYTPLIKHRTKIFILFKTVLLVFGRLSRLFKINYYEYSSLNFFILLE